MTHKYTIKIMKHSVSVVIWGCFNGKGGRGGLYFLPKNVVMNGDCYIQVLKKQMMNS